MKIHADSTIFRYPIGQFFGMIGILPDPGSPPESPIYRSSRGFYLCSILDRSVFRYSHGFYYILVMPRILPFIGVHADSTIFPYSIGRFSILARILPDPDSPPDSAIYRY